MKLLFRDKQFLYVSDYSINLIYNAVASTFNINTLSSILGPPLAYSYVEIYNDNDQLLITGYILSSGYIISAKPELEQYPGYSITGCLEDCSVPFPLQFNNMSLREITSKLLLPFGLSFTYTSNVAAEIDKKYIETIASDGQTIKDYLSELATQRGIILSHNSKGNLVFTKIEPDSLKSVAQFREGDSGATKITLTANGQGMHSDITIVKQASTENSNAGEFTIKNPYVQNRYRPVTKILSSGDIYDIQTAARMELSKELAGIEVSIDTPLFVLPGSIVEVQSDRLKLRKMTRFFVQETAIKGTVNGETYTLKCVLPDIYTTNPVKNIFL